MNTIICVLLENIKILEEKIDSVQIFLFLFFLNCFDDDVQNVN